MPWPVLGWMYAVKLLDGTIGKLMAAAAGIEGRDALPVARQSPPQYGRSLAGIICHHGVRIGMQWFGILTSSND